MSRGLSFRKLLLLGILLLSSNMFLDKQVLPAHAVTWAPPTQVPLTTVTNTKPSVAIDSFQSIWLVYQSSVFGVNPEIYYKIYNFIAWTPEALVTTDTNSNTAPNIYALANSTLFFTWVSNRTGHQNIWFKTNSGGVWSGEHNLTSTGPDDAPSVTQDSLGRIWVVWYRTSGSNAVLYDRIYTPGQGWGSEATVPVTNGSTTNILPSIRGASDGKVWLAWSSLVSGNYNIWRKTFDGSKWSTDARLTTYNGDDFGPSFVQSRDGTMWVVWSREIPVGKSFVSDLYFTNSTNLGLTWNATATALTSTLSFTDFNPAVVQSTKDKMLYVFWSSDMPSMTGYNLFYTSTGPFLTHDITVTSISVSPTRLYAGGLKSIGQSPIVYINFTIGDLGDFVESSQFVLFANSTRITSGPVTIQPSGTILIQAAWNTTGQVASCTFINATVTPVAGEILTTNNFRIYAYVALYPLGDFNLDGSVDIIDAGQLALAFQSTPGTPHWLPAADFNNNGIIDIIDASVLAFHFNQSIHC